MDATWLETCWRVRGRSGCIFRCGIVRDELGRLELRIEHGDQPDDIVVFSQIVIDVTRARELAVIWRETVLRAHFVELLN